MSSSFQQIQKQQCLGCDIQSVQFIRKAPQT